MNFMTSHTTNFAGFNISGITPKVGMLQNSAWNLTDICRFKILTAPPPANNQGSAEGFRPTSAASTSSTVLPGSSPTVKSKENTDRLDMPPPPSPASSTCSDTGSTSHSESTLLDDMCSRRGGCRM